MKLKKNKKAQHIRLKNLKKKLFFEKKLVEFADSFYICMCVFHSIRFKVNKVLGHGGDPFLFLYPVKDTKNAVFCKAAFLMMVFIHIFLLR